MLKERNVSKELAVRLKPTTMHCQGIVTVATNVKRAICDLSHDALICVQHLCIHNAMLCQIVSPFCDYRSVLRNKVFIFCCEQVRLKQRRRTLKNRNYASSCREKKDEEISGLERLKGQEVFDQNMHFWSSKFYLFIFLTSSIKCKLSYTGCKLIILYI